MKPNNIDFNCMENKTKTFFKISPFLVHGRKSFRSYSLSIFGWTIPLFLFCDSVLFGLVAIKVVLFFQILGKKTLSSLMMVTVQHVQIFFMRLSSVAPLSMCSSFPLQPQRLHLSSESLSGDKAYTSLLYLHPPSFSLPLIPLLASVFPTSICSAFPGSQWNERRACTLTGWNWTGLGACSLSLFHTLTHALSHTHVHANKQTQSRRLLRVRRAHAHACAAVLTRIDAPTHSQSLSIRWLQPWDEVMFWDRKHGAMGNSQRRAKGRHKTKGATGKAHTHVPVSHLDVCTDISHAQSCTTSHSTMPRSYFTITSVVVHVIVCVCARVRGYQCQWLVSCG